MKKIHAFILTAMVLSTPFVILAIINFMRIKPEHHHPIAEYATAQQPIIEPKEKIAVERIIVSQKEQQEQKPSESFITGYWDGWRGKLAGPFRWALAEDYRQGHMLGSYDRKNGIERYERP
jgi:hypothetical protein